MKLLLFLFLVASCENLNFSLVNQGTIVGDNTGNTSTATNEQELMDAEGAKILTPEEKETARKGFERGKSLAKEINLQSMLSMGSIHYVAANKRDWKGYGDQLDFLDFLEKHPKIKDAHEDLQFLLWKLWSISPTWVVTECTRNPDRQRKLVRQGKSWTQNSRHLLRPAQACDLVTVRKGRKDFQDIDMLGFYLGITQGLADMLKDAPCGLFGSTVENTIFWTKRDLYHHQNNLRPECSGKTTFRLFNQKTLLVFQN